MVAHHERLRRDVAGLRDAAVRGHPAGRDIGVGRLRRLDVRGGPDLRAISRSSCSARSSPPAQRRTPSYFGTVQWAQRLLPGQLYAEASAAILSPGVTSVSASDIYGASATPRVDSLLTFDQSLLLVWPHIVILVALTLGCFALAYARFMRQEVRA